MVKYVLVPQEVKSADGDRHFISAPQLADLYGVSMKDCIIRDYRRPETLLGYSEDYLNSLTWLLVQDDGQYSLPPSPVS